MFELLAPVFAVVGGIAAATPFVLHMFRRTPAVKAPFSLVRFLTPTLPKTTKRSRLEHWPLMLLRILAVALIALAFARPFQRATVAREQTEATGRHLSIVLDASASMRRDGLRDAVLAEVQKLTADLNPQDVLSISSYSTGTKRLLTAEEWKQSEVGARPALITRVIETWEPDWKATRTAQAILEAADEVAREKGVGNDSERSVVLVTDFQEGSDLDLLRSGNWPDSVRLELRIVKPTAVGNAGISLAEEQKTGLVRVRVTNSGDATLTKYSLQPFDDAGKPVGTPIVADVAPGQRRTFSVPEQVAGQPRISGIELLGDAQPFDNVVDLPIEDPRVLRIAHAGSTDPNNAEQMRYYLQRVLDGDESEPIELIDLLNSENIAVPPPADARLAIVTEKIPENMATSLKDFLDRGNMVMVALNSVEMFESIKSVLPGNISVSEATVTDYAMLGQLDFSSSLLAPFAEARFSDFSSIKFWHYRTLAFDEKAANAPRVIARFDSGSPAIVEATNDAGGRLYLVAAGWQPTDSQWALSTRFPSMIARLIRLAYPRSAGHLLFAAGDTIQPEELARQEKWTLLDPEQKPVTLQASQPGAEGQDDKSTSTQQPSVIELDRPGRWVLTAETNEGPKSTSLLVSVPASESRTEPLPAGQLQALGMSADVTHVAEDSATPVDPATASQLDASELESQQKYWRYCLLAGLALLVIEALVAASIERRQNIEAVQA
ncbi:MAG: BatA domain-containing protein [Planctomycetaceae bacterium]